VEQEKEYDPKKPNHPNAKSRRKIKILGQENRNIV
jgi:hypothetical protein